MAVDINQNGSNNLRHRRNKNGGGGHGSTTAGPSSASSTTIDDDPTTTTTTTTASASSSTSTSNSDSEATEGYVLTPLEQRSILTRLDVGPFVLMYSCLIVLDFLLYSANDSSVEQQQQRQQQNQDYSNNTSGNSQYEWVSSFIVFPVVLLSHLSLFLLQQWNVSWRVTVGYRKGSASWTHCWVVAPHVDQHHSADDSGIVPVEFRQQQQQQQQQQHQQQSSSSTDIIAVVNFQDVVFRGIYVYNPNKNDYDTNKIGETDSSISAKSMKSKASSEDIILWSVDVPSSSSSSSSLSKDQDNDEDNSKPGGVLGSWRFHRLRYPIHFPLDFYQRWKGHSSIQQLTLAKDVYGTNTTPIELPPFSELLQEQVVAPFFLFQVLCVLLWSLDEYWYYALFTFFALLMFESTVAYNRLKSLQRLRSYTIHEQRPIWVFRPSYPPIGKNGWIQILISELLPGDLVSCKRLTLGRRRNGNSISSRRQNDNDNTKIAQKEQQYNRIPADILVLNGDAVVDESLLTGESVPQLKSSLEVDMAGVPTSTTGNTLDLQEHKQFILFGGTTMLVSNSGQSTLDGVPNPPDDGAVGMVLRTGFETAQGSLLRTMAHTQKAVDGIHTRDTYVFILMLLCCAVASATVVWNHGWADEDRNKFRLILHVIIIVTSVVPPELPMELSLAVTNSVADLMRRKIFCTEVFRIPLAGQVDVCCFDKTGTLTSDEMQLKGVRVVDGKEQDVSKPAKDGDSLFSDVLTPDDRESIPWPTSRIMVGCHSLGLGGDTRSGYAVIGDPLEKTVLQQTGYQLVQNNALKRMDDGATSSERPDAILILHRFAFSSRLKRMSVLAQETSDKKILVLSKGAPETLKMFLRPDSIPHDYDDISRHHMALGQRVLAMGYRELTSKEAAGNLKDLNREDVESNLIFAGFLLLQCPIKSDSKAVVSELWGSGQRVVMITGDALLTAAEVARQVGIIRKSGESIPASYQLEASPTSKVPACMDDILSQFQFSPMTTSEKSRANNLSLVPQRLDVIKKLVEKNEIALCVSGDILQQLVVKILELELRMGGLGNILNDEKQALFHPAAQNALKDIVPLVSVFARHAPRQKEAIVAAYNLSSMKTLMCGDGTNDVGALRRAHVGISIISSPEVEAKQRHASGTISRLKKERKKAKSSKRVKNSDALALEDSIRQLQEAQDELDQVELGDASIASPFTSRMVSIKCCKDVLQQGRCTLVTMLQIYKILGVNCLVNAMILSKLFLHGVKQGDRQLTILGLIVAALFFFVTRGKPLPVLSDVRPPTSVLSASALLSIATQFTVHYLAMVVATEVALSFVDPYDPSMIPDGPFNPNALNTCTFLVSAVATVNTFAVNYAGEPFVEPLSKNKMMFRSLQLSYGVLIICALEVFPPLNDLLQLDPLPDSSQFGEMEWMSTRESSAWVSGLISVVKEIGLPIFLSGLMIADTVLVFVAEKGIVSLFQGPKKLSSFKHPK